jgi:uncharacterized membrane protein YjfL (UPF0719 family)
MLALGHTGVNAGVRVSLPLRAATLALGIPFLVSIIAIVGVLQTVWWVAIAGIILISGAPFSLTRPSRSSTTI